MARVVPSQVVELLDLVFPWAATQKPDETMRIRPEHDGNLAGLVAMVSAIPEDLITLPPNDASKFNLALWTIRAQLDSWRAHGKTGSLERITGVDKRNPVTVLRECLAKCPDEPIASTSNELSFVKDNDLRMSLLADLSAVSRALNNGEWKAATVLSGSLLEALLLWAVSKVKSNDATAFNAAVSRATARGLNNKKPPNDLDQWVLHHLIEVTFDIGIIATETATQARLAKDFRNLIHPGRSTRLATSCSIGTAMAARAAVEFTTLDLAKKFP